MWGRPSFFVVCHTCGSREPARLSQSRARLADHGKRWSAQVCPTLLLLGGLCRGVGQVVHLHRRVVVEDSLAAFAYHDLVTLVQIL